MDTNHFKKLTAWSGQFSHLPWRKNRSLYTTLVSEIMLQQTTVGTVVNHFSSFLDLFPDLKTLSETTEEKVLWAWHGLGYYRRAKNLHKAVITIQNEYKGKMPSTVEELVKIPGIGDYTANALIGIGMNQKACSIDANLERVLSRYYLLPLEMGLPLKKEIKKRLSEGRILKSLATVGYRAGLEALMDLGREICIAKNPKCTICPIQKSCQALKNGEVHQLPKKNEKKKVSYQLELLRLVVKKRGRKELLLNLKKDSEWLSGQWEFPTLILKSADEKLKQYPRFIEKIKNTNVKKMPQYSSLITKYKIKNYIYEIDEDEFRAKYSKYFQTKQLKYEKVKKIISREGQFATSTMKGVKLTLFAQQ